LKSFQKGSTCENLSQKELKIKKVSRYYRLMTKWSGLCDSTELS
jgi:hypothetical protein